MDGRTAMAAMMLAATAGATLGACGVGGPTRVIGTDRLTDDLTDDVVAEYGVEAKDVRCPDEVGVDEGETFTCEVDLDGGTLTYLVTQVDDQGQLRFEPRQAVVPPQRAAARIANHYIDVVGKNVDVFCGQREVEVRVIEPGASFVCRVVDRQGSTDGAVVSVTDLTGEFTFEVRPGDASGAEY